MVQTPGFDWRGCGREVAGSTSCIKAMDAVSVACLAIYIYILISGYVVSLSFFFEMVAET